MAPPPSGPPPLKALLRTAKEALAKGDHAGAVEACKAVVARDSNSYEAHVFMGKSLFKLGRSEEAVAAYESAAEINPEQPTAFQGLLEVHTSKQNDSAAVPVLEKLVGALRQGGNDAKAVEFARQLAAALSRLGRSEEAAKHAGEALASLPPSSPPETRLELLRAVVDYQLLNPARGSSGVTPELEELCGLVGTWSSPEDARYLEARLRTLMEQRHGGLEASEAALAAVSSAVKGGGCASPVPLCAFLLLFDEAAVLQEQNKGGDEAQEVFLGGVPFSDGVVRCRLAHAFPGRAAAAAAWGRELAGRSSSQGEGSSGSSSTRLAAHAAKLLSSGLQGGGGGPLDWVALALLQNSSSALKSCLATVEKGLQALKAPANAWAAPSKALASAAAVRLRLLAADCRLRLGESEEAEAAFRQLSASSACTAEQRDQAQRGQVEAAVLGARLEAAKDVCRAALRADPSSSPPPAWAKATLGWLHVGGDEGCGSAAPEDLEKAQQVLEQVAAESRASGAAPSDTARFCYWLGRVMWARGGEWREDRQHAHAQLLNAAAVPGKAQGAAFAWIGEYCNKVLGDPVRARACFQKALGLDGSITVAGEGLFEILQESGSTGLCSLCEGMLARAPGAAWAHRRLGLLQLQSGDGEQAVASLQHALRADPASPAAWEWLGATYQSLGRSTAACKSFTRALELDPSRLYARISLASVHLDLGELRLAEEQFKAALVQDSGQPVALLGLALAGLRACAADLVSGAPGSAALSLHRAAKCAARAAALCPNSTTAWQALGDCHLLHHRTTPATVAAKAKEGPGGSVVVPSLESSLEGWRARAERMREARVAYSRAVRLNPAAAGLWGSLAASYHHEAALREAHPSLGATQDAVKGLRLQAERCLRGAIRLDPTDPRLWAALGEVAEKAEQREEALSRALALDPKYVLAWTALGRLYAGAGNLELAEQAYEQARISFPEFAPTWEGMAVMALLGGGAGGSGAAELLEYATQLHGSGGAQAAFALAALAGAPLPGGASSTAARPGRVYAAARRAAEEQPLDALAASALGVAALGRGLPGRAAAASRAAEELVQCSSQDDPRAATQLRWLRQVQARALLSGGHAAEAAELLSSINTTSAEADAYRTLGAAQLEAGDALRAAATFQELLNSDLGAEAEAAVRVDAVQALCRAQEFSLAGAEVEALVKLMAEAAEPSKDRTAARQGVRRAVVALAAGAALGPPGTPQVRLQQCAGLESRSRDSSIPLVAVEAFAAEILTPEVLAGVLAVQSVASRVGDGGPATRLAARAIHLCPWSPAARWSLAAARGPPPQAPVSARAAAVHLCPWQPCLWDRLRDVRGINRDSGAAGPAGVEPSKLLQPLEPHGSGAPSSGAVAPVQRQNVPDPWDD